MSDGDLTSLSNEELAELWQEAMTEEQEALKAEQDYMRQAERLARGRTPEMPRGEATRLADAAEMTKERRLAIEAEEQRRRRLYAKVAPDSVGSPDGAMTVKVSTMITWWWTSGTTCTNGCRIRLHGATATPTQLH
jgi:hypothetical protein